MKEWIIITINLSLLFIYWACTIIDLTITPLPCSGWGVMNPLLPVVTSVELSLAVQLQWSLLVWRMVPTVHGTLGSISQWRRLKVCQPQVYNTWGRTFCVDYCGAHNIIVHTKINSKVTIIIYHCNNGLLESGGYGKCKINSKVNKKKKKKKKKKTGQSLNYCTHLHNHVHNVLDKSI